MLSIREDGRVEWNCKHGVGHTIAVPYHIAKLISERDGDVSESELNTHFSHGCDGCCGQGKNGTETW